MENNIIIWLCPADELLAQEVFDRYILSVSEYRQNIISKYRFSKDKALSLAAGIMLSCALKSKGISEKECKYIKTGHGRPELYDYPEISFNISHSGNMAALIFSDKYKVSIDIEQIRESSYSVVKRFFSAYERGVYESLPPEKKDAFFYEGWTAREACGKLSGRGLDFSNPLINNAYDTDFLESNGIYIKRHSINRNYMIAAASEDISVYNTIPVAFGSITELFP